MNPYAPRTLRAHPNIHRRRRLIAGVSFLLLLAAASALAMTRDPAGAQTATQRLHQLEAEQNDVAGDIDGLNQQVDSLIGEMSDLKVREEELNKALAQKKVELKEAEAKLAEGEAQLVAVRAQLQRAMTVLRDRLVQIYKSDQPDMLSILLEQSSISDVEASSEYLDRIQNADENVVNRVHDLRDEVKHQVALLTETRNTVEAAKQSILDQQAELVQTRASLETQKAELVSARQAREKVLDRLRSQSSALEGSLNGPLSGGETVPSSPGKAGLVDGIAIPPDNAPPQVVDVINAANSISDTPYVWGGGHGSFESSGYDCSGAVSYALHGGGFLSSPLDSTGLTTWGSAGWGEWISVLGNSGHVYMYVAGLRFDTSQSGGNGPNWTTSPRSNTGFTVRHPSGF